MKYRPLLFSALALLILGFKLPSKPSDETLEKKLVGYWYGASQIGAAVLDRVIAAAAARGYAAECQGIAGGGFPLSVDLSCQRASIADANGGMSAFVEGFSATTPLYLPGRIEWAARGPLVVDLPTSASNLTAAWRDAETRLNAGFGGLSGVATRLQDLRMAFPVLPDLPQFAAQLSIWVHLDDPAYGFAELFEIHWFTPYLVAFLLARPFVGLLGVIGAVKLVVWLGLIATPLALRALLRAVGRDPWPPGRRSCG